MYEFINRIMDGFVAMIESSKVEDIKKDDHLSNLSILQSGNGGPRRRYHRKDAKKKKVEDPNAPRRARSAYVHFLSSQRAKYGSAKQGFDQREINEKLAAEWRGLSDSERRIFIERSNREKEEYAILLNEYVKTDSFKQYNVQKNNLKKKSAMGWSEDEDDSHHMTNKKSKKHHHKEKYFDLEPREKNIFSDQFIQYNKDQETTLRIMRRQIGQTEDELISLKKISHQIDSNKEAMKNTIEKDRLEMDRLDDIISSWSDILREHIDADIYDDKEIDVWMEEIVSHPDKNKEQIERISNSIHSLSFYAPK